MVGIGLLACVGALGYLVLQLARTPEPGATQNNFHRLRVGMPCKEVEAILGPAPFQEPGAPGPHNRIWATGDDRHMIIARFDWDGKLHSGTLIEYISDPTSQRLQVSESPRWLDAIRRWVGF